MLFRFKDNNKSGAKCNANVTCINAKTLVLSFNIVSILVHTLADIKHFFLDIVYVYIL